MKILRQLIGGLMALTFSPFLAMAVWDLLTGGSPETSRGVLVGICVFTAMGAGSGVRLIFGSRREEPAQLGGAPPRELLALKLARAAGGTIGPSELATGCNMSFADARATLESLCSQGACEPVVTEEGAILYRFPDLALPDAERHSAKSPLQ